MEKARATLEAADRFGWDKVYLKCPVHSKASGQNGGWRLFPSLAPSSDVGLGFQTAWVQMLAPSSIGCETLDGLLNLLGSRFRRL